MAAGLLEYRLMQIARSDRIEIRRFSLGDRMQYVGAESVNDRKNVANAFTS